MFLPNDILFLILPRSSHHLDDGEFLHRLCESLLLVKDATQLAAGDV
jgi:hypothetical protein